MAKSLKGTYANEDTRVHLGDIKTLRKMQFTLLHEVNCKFYAVFRLCIFPKTAGFKSISLILDISRKMPSTFPVP